MRRVMVVGAPGAGKSTLARALGAATGLPVFHVDHIHWMPGWVERDRAQKTRLCHAVEAGDRWIFEGGHSATWPNRAGRADTLVWLDLPVGLRLWRVLRRIVTYRDHASRPDLPAGCAERFDPEFLRYIVATRRRGRAKIAATISAAPHLIIHHLRTRTAVRHFLDAAA